MINYTDYTLHELPWQYYNYTTYIDYGGLYGTLYTQ